MRRDTQTTPGTGVLLILAPQYRSRHHHHPRPHPPLDIPRLQQNPGSVFYPHALLPTPTPRHSPRAVPTPHAPAYYNPQLQQIRSTASKKKRSILRRACSDLMNRIGHSIGHMQHGKALPRISSVSQFALPFRKAIIHPSHPHPALGISRFQYYP